MMQPENRHEIDRVVRGMQSGEQWKFTGSFRQFFPNPVWPAPDDHLEIGERARRFFSARGVTARETPEGKILITK